MTPALARSFVATPLRKRRLRRAATNPCGGGGSGGGGGDGGGSGEVDRSGGGGGGKSGVRGGGGGGGGIADAIVAGEAVDEAGVASLAAPVEAMPGVAPVLSQAPHVLLHCCRLVGVEHRPASTISRHFFRPNTSWQTGSSGGAGVGGGGGGGGGGGRGGRGRGGGQGRGEGDGGRGGEGGGEDEQASQPRQFGHVHFPSGPSQRVKSCRSQKGWHTSSDLCTGDGGGSE